MSTRPRRARRSWSQRGLLTVNILLVFACVAAAAGLTVFKAKAKEVSVYSLGASLAPPLNDDEPHNYLIIGTDNASGLAPGDPVLKGRDVGGNGLADVEMILRVDPRTDEARLLSIPRDTLVDIAPYGTPGKINASIAGPNGPQNLIQTIKNTFGISIDNFVEIDFEGFRQLVQILGGVPIYLTTPIRDHNTGLFQPKTGCILLDPVQALAYARSRHFQYQKNGKWVDDPSSDLGRITRQQDFIRRAAKRAIDKGVRNPATALSLATAATKVIKVDSSLTVGQIVDVINRFRNFNVDGLQSMQVPTVADTRNGIDYQDVVWDQAEPMLDYFRGTPQGQAITPRDVLVSVSGAGQGASTSAAVTAGFEKAGFDADDASGASTSIKSKSRGSTTISYGSKGRDAAIEVARWIDSPVRYVYDATLRVARVLLDLGADFVSVRDKAVDAATVKQPPPQPVGAFPTGGSSSGSTTSTAAGAAGSTASTQPGATTTSTSPGFVPTDASAAAKCDATA